MAQVSSSLIVSLIDRISGPARGAANSLRGIGAAADGIRGRFAGVMRGNSIAAADFNRSLLAISGSVAVVGYGLRRALGPAVSRAVNFETTLEDIGQKANLAGGDLLKLGDRIRTIAKETGRAAQDTASTFDTLIGLGLGGKTDAENVEAAVGMLPAVGKTATAYRAATDDIARAGQAVFANLKVPAAEIIRAFDAMAQSGKDGAFELKDQARYFPSLTAMAANLGVRGVKGVADLAAALQVVRQGAGTSEEAATNLLNVLQKAGTPTTQKNFRKLGIDFRKEMERAGKAGISPIEAMAELTDRALKKGATIGDLFEDRQAQLGILALIADMERYRRVRTEAMKAIGVVEADYKRRIETSAAAFDRFGASVDNLQTALGNRLLPTLVTGADEITKALDSLDQRVSVFDRIGQAVAGLMTGLGFDGMTDFKTAMSGLVDAIFGSTSSFAADTARLAEIFEQFREMGGAARELGAAIDGLMRPLLEFAGTDWGAIAGWGVTIGGAAIGLSAFAKSVRMLGSALLFLSGAKAGISVLKAVGVLGGGTAGAGAGVGAAGAAGVAAGTAGRRALLGRLGLAGAVGLGAWELGTGLYDGLAADQGDKRLDPLAAQHARNRANALRTPAGAYSGKDASLGSSGGFRGPERMFPGGQFTPISELGQARMNGSLAALPSAWDASELDQSAAARAAGQATMASFNEGLDGEMAAARAKVAAFAAEIANSLSVTIRPRIAMPAGFGSQLHGLHADYGISE